MKRPVLFAIFLVVLALAVVIAAMNLLGFFLPDYDNDIDSFMESRIEAMGVPGMAAGIVEAGGIAWEGYYGTLDGSRPVSEDTLFMIASVSKTVIATAAMQLWEQGVFELDDDINDTLDFEVRNPKYPSAPVTFRQLMTHQSTIRDGDCYHDLYTITAGGGDSPLALGEFLEAYLAAGGRYYDEKNYLDAVPGERFEYSNYGAALLAYLVEELSGQDFAVYCHEHIFQPLGMEHSYYLLSDIPSDETEIAVPFKNSKALPHYSYPDYPAGSLRTTLRDLSRFAAFFLDAGGSEPVILKPETVTLMFGEYGESTDAGEERMGLLWVHMDWIYLEAVGHTGGDPGVSTFLLLYPDEGFATILFMNEMPRNFIVQHQVCQRLHDEGRNLAGAR